MTLVDLSHVIHDGLVTYPGLPAPVIRDHLSRADSRRTYAQGTEFHIGRIEMVANTGTYLDTPSHRFEGKPDLAGVPLGALANLEGIVLRPALAGRRLDAGILVVEHLSNLSALPAAGFRFFAVPPLVRGMGTFPVRAFALVP